MLSVLPYFLANVALVFLEAFLRNILYIHTVPVRRPRVLLWGVTGVTVLIWAINSYAYATALLDIVIMILFVFVAPCLTEKGFRLKGLLTTVIFLAIEVAGMNGVALAAFPIAEQLRYQIRMAEEQLEIQNGYYRQSQDSILTVNQIRHDLTNQLQVAYALLEQGEQNKARYHLDQIQSGVRDRVVPQFCPNLMVDAVLSEKARLCRELGIRLDINAQLPPELPVESAHLCSAFSNLLDNGIHAVRDISVGEKYMELRTPLHADCLIIRCTNPSAPPVRRKGTGDPLRLHGLGLDILSRIAKQYHGSLDTEYHNGLFEVTLILNFAK